MATQDLIAVAETQVKAPASKVWAALTDPALIKQYMFGAEVVSDWQVGSPIVWKGEWKGKPYEDKGKILRMEPPRVLQYSHYSPMTGQPDTPENYHTVTIELGEKDGGTWVTLTQDNNTSTQEKESSQKNWEGMLEGLKKAVE